MNSDIDLKSQDLKTFNFKDFLKSKSNIIKFDLLGILKSKENKPNIPIYANELYLNKIKNLEFFIEQIKIRNNNNYEVKTYLEIFNKFNETFDSIPQDSININSDNQNIIKNFFDNYLELVDFMECIPVRRENPKSYQFKENLFNQIGKLYQQLFQETHNRIVLKTNYIIDLKKKFQEITSNKDTYIHNKDSSYEILINNNFILETELFQINKLLKYGYIKHNEFSIRIEENQLKQILHEDYQNLKVLFQYAYYNQEYYRYFYFKKHVIGETRVESIQNMENNKISNLNFNPPPILDEIIREILNQYVNSKIFIKFIQDTLDNQIKIQYMPTLKDYNPDLIIPLNNIGENNSYDSNLQINSEIINQIKKFIIEDKLILFYTIYEFNEKENTYFVKINNIDNIPLVFTSSDKKKLHKYKFGDKIKLQLINYNNNTIGIIPPTEKGRFFK